MRKEFPTDLTFQDFERLAERAPTLEGNWIYRLTRTVVCDIEEIEIKENEYPKYDVYEDLPIWFLTFQAAENRIKEIASEGKDNEQTYSFEIVQFPIGTPAEQGARWLYDRAGKLLDYAITPWSGDPMSTAFFGRSENRNRFKKGDIVETVYRGEVTLSLLVNNPPSVGQCWNLYLRCLNDEDGRMPYFLDASDDCCYLVDGPGHEYHSHVSPLQIMKPRFPVPEALEKEMRGWLERLDDQKA